MITNHRMGLKIWRIQRIKIPGITETKRKPLDYKARQRVGVKEAGRLFEPSRVFLDSLLPVVFGQVAFGGQCRVAPLAQHLVGAYGHGVRKV